MSRGVKVEGSRVGFCEGVSGGFLFGLDLWGSSGVSLASRLSRFSARGVRAVGSRSSMRFSASRLSRSAARGVRAEGSRSRGWFCEGFSGRLL